MTACYLFSKKFVQVNSRIIRFIELVEEWLLVLLLFGMIAVAACQVILRNVFDMGLFWGDGSVLSLIHI